MMQWRAILVIAISILAVASLLLLLPSPPATSPDANVVIERSQEGDVVTARVVAYNGSQLVYASTSPVKFAAGQPGSGDMPGLASYLLNVSTSQTVNVTLRPWEAFGNYSWDNVVNVTRLHTLARDQNVSQRALERFTGQPASVGQRVALPQWPTIVTSLQAGVATLHADVKVGDSVHRLQYWPSTVVGATNNSIDVRDDATVGTPVDTPADNQGNPASFGNVTLVNETAIQVDFNPPHAGMTVTVTATVISIKPGSATLGFVAKLEAQQASCESHHAGFVSFQATSDVAPNANGTSWVNVTIGDPWHHDLTQAQVKVANDTQSVPTLTPGQSFTLSFLEPSNGSAPVTISGDAHFIHGGGAPDDSLYSAQGVANLAVRHQAAPVSLAGALVNASAVTVTWGRVLGWLAIPLMLYPAWEGWRSRQARLQARPRAYTWPKWLDLHTFPALAATLVSFLHGAVLMLDVYRGNTNTGVWSGIVALLVLSALGGSGLFMARWIPARWRQARAWHAGLTVIVLVLGLVHALLIGTTFKFLRR